MNIANVRRFVWQWFRYTIRDAFAQTFGWPTLFGGWIGGFFLVKFGIGALSGQVANNIVAAAGGLLIGFAAYVVAGFFKARRHMDPLTLSITDDVRSPDFTFNDQFRGYNVAAIVQNRSDVHLKDCIAYVMNAPQHDGSTGMRFVEKFDLPPKSKKTVFVAYWFSREPPNTDDKDIGLTGPVSASFGGNVYRVPSLAAMLHIRIHPQDADGKNVHCRVWVDTTARRLRAEQLPD